MGQPHRTVANEPVPADVGDTNGSRDRSSQTAWPVVDARSDGAPTPATASHAISGESGSNDRPVARVPVNVSGAGRRALPPISLELALYAALILIAIVTRFWDLDQRALHHDESLHAYYSWLLATGSGYTHDPLMHGPFLFYATALVYLLVGDSDATSRYLPALCGVLLVWLPYLLRGPRHLGRWGALTASALMLISPALLYQSRYLRHDSFTHVGSLVLFVAIMRYLERPERKWLILAGGTLGFLLTNHEIVFGIGALFLGILWGALLWGRLRPLVPFHIVWVALAGIVMIIVSRRDGPFPSIPWDRRGVEAPRPTRDNQVEYFQSLATHPSVITGLLLLVAFVGVARFILARHRHPDLIRYGWIPSLFVGARRHSVEEGVLNVWRDRTGFGTGIAVGAIIFVSLYTSLFTNIAGIFTGTVATNGTLFYWLGQQDVRRGEQPWFYFLLLMPQYEFLAVTLGGVGVVLATIAALRAMRGTDVGPRLFCHLFLTIWFVGIFVALSYAGEKMPWLVTHITLPASLLAAAVIGELIERAVAWQRTQRQHAFGGQGKRLGFAAPDLFLGGALLVIGSTWLLIAADLSYGAFVTSSDTGDWQRTISTDAAGRWWWLAAPPAAAIALITTFRLWRGSQRTVLVTMAALIVGLATLQIHAGWRTTYQEGDVPKDMLIYTQTSPDVHLMMQDIGELSASLTGGKNLEVWYDGGVSWPMQWYLRDFKRHYYTDLSEPPNDAPLILAQSDRESAVEPFLDNYTAQEYVLRWWFPEYEIYRNFAIAPELGPGPSAWKVASEPHGPVAVAGSVLDSLVTQLNPSGQQCLYRLLMYRELPTHIQSYNYVLYVRNDLVPLFNQIRYD